MSYQPLPSSLAREAVLTRMWEMHGRKFAKPAQETSDPKLTPTPSDTTEVHAD